MSPGGLIIAENIMPIHIHPLSGSSFDALADRLRLEDAANAWVLVSGAGDQRLVRRALQKKLLGLAPPVEVLTRQIAAWLKFGAPEEEHVLFLNRKERRLALDEWRRGQASILDEVWTDRLDRFLSYLYRAGLDPAQLPPLFGEHASYCKSFIEWCQARGWYDRAGLFLMADAVPQDAFDMDSIHLFLTVPLIPYERVAMDALIRRTEELVDWHIYKPSGISTGLDADPISALSPAHPVEIAVAFREAHHVRVELEDVFARIKSQVAGSIEGVTGSRFADYVIVSADFEAHQALLPVMEARFGVPVTATRGRAVIGDPALARLRAFLYLGKNGFPIDDVVDVFADQVIPLPGYDQHENQTPNLRTFSRLCRRYNIRDLQQACDELERAIRRETEREAQRMARMAEAGGDAESSPPEFEVRHGPFYLGVRERLVELRERYPKGRQPLVEWFRWAAEMLGSLGTLRDPSFMSALTVLARHVREGLGMAQRLGTNPPTDDEGFAYLLESLLDGQIPVADHPGKVLFTPLEDTRCIEGKIVFMMGLNDDTFPSSLLPEDQFPGLSTSALAWLASRQDDELEVARNYLDTVARFSHSLQVSWAKYRGKKALMASPLLIDHSQHFPGWIRTDAVAVPTEACLDRLDFSLRSAVLPSGLEEGVGFRDPGDRARLAAHVAAVRRDPNAIGPWEGQLAAAPDSWKELAGRLVADSGGTQQLRLSVSRLDEFAASPLEFFFKRVLRLEPPEEYSDEAEQNRKGDLLHAALEAFYSHSERYGPAIDPRVDEASARRRLRTIAEDLFAERVEDLGYADTPYPEILKQRILLTLDAFVTMEHDGLGRLSESARNVLKPSALWDTQEKGTEVAFEFDLDVDGEPVTLNGFIDRIDRDSADDVRFVVDYKTGGDYSVKEFERHMFRGLSFQLPLYLKAMSLDRDRELLAAYYHLRIDHSGAGAKLKGLLGDAGMVEVGRPSKDTKGALSPSLRKAFIDAVLERRLLPVVRAIREGRFHQSLTRPSDYSDFKSMTRWSEAVAALRGLTFAQKYGVGDEIFGTYYIDKEILSEEERAALEGGSND